MLLQNPLQKIAIGKVSQIALFAFFVGIGVSSIATARSASGESIAVAFLELRNYRGDLVRLEPRFPWAHMAVSWRGGWLHAHPAKGVEWVSMEELERYGRVAHVTSVVGQLALDDQLATSALGKPYDHQFSWTDQAYYCSELVAKLLGIKPVPMVFDPAFWPPTYQHLNGMPGISPRLVFLKLVEESN